MQEFDLQDIWEGADVDAAQWYERLRPELVAMARQKNDSVLQRIRRMVLWEIVFALLTLAVSMYYLRDLPVFLFVGLIAFFMVVITISYRYYLQFSREIGQVPSLNIVESTSAYLRILSNYKNRLVRLSIILMPLGLIVGFFAGFGVGAENDFSALREAKFWLITIENIFDPSAQFQMKIIDYIKMITGFNIHIKKWIRVNWWRVIHFIKCKILLDIYS